MIRIALSVLFFILSLTTQAAADPTEIAYGAHKDQRFDVYAPSGARNAPIVVFLHGGSWAFGDKSNADSGAAKAEHWLSKGYVYISVNTRLLPDADAVEQTHDLARAMSAIQSNARDWGGDPRKIVLMGHSAGGHVVALLATRDDLRARYGVRDWSGTVTLDSAGLDIESVMSKRPPMLMRRVFGRDPAFWAAASPAAHADRRDGPFLAVCSSRRQFPCQDAQLFEQKAGDVQILPVDLSHMEINGNIGDGSLYARAVDRWVANAFGS